MIKLTSLSKATFIGVKKSSYKRLKWQLYKFTLETYGFKNITFSQTQLL